MYGSSVVGGEEARGWRRPRWRPLVGRRPPVVKVLSRASGGGASLASAWPSATCTRQRPKQQHASTAGLLCLSPCPVVCRPLRVLRLCRCTSASLFLWAAPGRWTIWSLCCRWVAVNYCIAADRPHCDD